MFNKINSLLGVQEHKYYYDPLSNKRAYDVFNFIIIIWVISSLLKNLPSAVDTIEGWTTPEKPVLAVNETTESKPVVQGAATDEKLSKENDIKANLACLYAQQYALSEQCSNSQVLELDGDFNTAEVLLLDGNHDDCLESDCKLILVQMTHHQINAALQQIFGGGKVDAAKVNAMRFGGQAIAEWDKVVLPAVVSTERYQGWNSLALKHSDGHVSDWYIGRQ